MARALVVTWIALLAIAGCFASAGSSTAPFESPEPAVPYACFGLEDSACRAVLDAALADLAPNDVLVYAEIGPFGCSAPAGCANTLAARPSGVVTLERSNGASINLGITAAPDGSITTIRDDFASVSLAPSSAAANLVGPVPYTLGHCGLYSGIDVDGSWWDPIGFVDVDHSAAINAADGTFTPVVDGNHATFTTDDGFTVTLVRRIGEKHLPMCM